MRKSTSILHYGDVARVNVYESCQVASSNCVASNLVECREMVHDWPLLILHRKVNNKFSSLIMRQTEQTSPPTESNLKIMVYK